LRQSNAVPQVLKSVRGQLLSVDEAVKITRLGKDWYYRHMRNGTLPFKWFLLDAGKRFMDSADISDWLEKKEVPAATKPKDKKEVCDVADKKRIDIQSGGLTTPFGAAPAKLREGTIYD